MAVVNGYRVRGGGILWWCPQPVTPEEGPGVDEGI